ncbi:MAG TPA: LPS-assembly protein LptD [Burkholderiaceae bacterium]|nr:LPS-assembly protein LptD [Burkholderiaceae bacterium]
MVSIPRVRVMRLIATLMAACCVGAFAQTTTDNDLTLRPALRLERALGGGRPAGNIETPAYVRADRISGEMEETVRLDGSAEMRRAGTVVRGDHIDYTVATDHATIEGNARLFRDGTTFTGPSLQLQVDALTGTMPDADFTYAPRQGRGSSSLIEFLGHERLIANDATYTSCGPGDNGWWVQANQLEIDRGEELAVARGARIYFEGVPIFASPYFQFPLGERRRSGILTPSFVINSTLGYEVTVPWYWDIAPNRDFTLAPRIMSRRGILLENEFRFLEPTVRGRLGYDVIAHDRSTGTKRDNISIQTEYANFVGVSGGINYNRVSDDRFFVDFGRTITSSSQAVLPQEAFVAYNKPFFASALRISKNQTLQDPAAPITPPYERVPQLTLGSLRYDWYGFDPSINIDATHFSCHSCINVVTQTPLEEGSRVVINPVISYPIQAPGWFFIPKAQWSYTAYSLDPAVHPDNSRPTRSLPLYSVDTGLVFERDGLFFGDASTQTLEPRLYYAYVPFRDQSNLPNFDSALADFNFTQLFTENIYSGSDRIGEANQLTAAIVGRVFDPVNGGERMRIALGQRFYFASQRVTLLPTDPQRTDKTSDILFAFSGAIARHVITDIEVEHSTDQNQVVRSNLGVRWQPAPASVVSLSYRYTINDIEQVDLSAQWPLTRRLYGVGRLNYSLKDRSWIETLAGLEYKADCWLLRFAAQRFATSSLTTTTAVFLQLELNGLASVGPSPVEQLRRSIAGYQVINPPPRVPGPYDYYE